jgi:hypothetical protein
MSDGAAVTRKYMIHRGDAAFGSEAQARREIAEKTQSNGFVNCATNPRSDFWL